MPVSRHGSKKKPQRGLKWIGAPARWDYVAMRGPDAPGLDPFLVLGLEITRRSHR